MVGMYFNIQHESKYLKLYIMITSTTIESFEKIEMSFL